MDTKQKIFILLMSWRVQQCLVFLGLSYALFNIKAIKTCIIFWGTLIIHHYTSMHFYRKYIFENDGFFLSGSHIQNLASWMSEAVSWMLMLGGWWGVEWWEKDKVQKKGKAQSWGGFLMADMTKTSSKTGDCLPIHSLLHVKLLFTVCLSSSLPDAFSQAEWKTCYI